MAHFEYGKSPEKASHYTEETVRERVNASEESLVIYENGYVILLPKEEGSFEVKAVINGGSDQTGIAFREWDEEVVDEDAGDSSASQVWRFSERLQWNDVTLTPAEITAPTLQRAKEALEHVTFTAYNLDEL